jgi:VanZ like family/Concanavalin A-like lectin/glucanases superfamily
LLCALTTLGILVCTLWPFNPFPRNRVSWLESADGIRFSQRGVVLSPQTLELSGLSSASDCSLELWIRPAQTDSVSTVLDFYDPGNPWRFLVRQYHSGLIVSHDVPVQGEKPRRIKLDIDDGLRQDELTFITITSGRDGTHVYFDAKPKRTFPHFQISLDDLSGQLILGSSTVQPDAWSGDVRALALYPRELSPEEVLGSYRRWTQSPRSDGSGANSAAVFYAFSERRGNLIHDRGASHRDLLIPSAYQVPHHSFLTPPWREFDLSWDYFWDVLRNILGFMPLGFLLCALFRRSAFPRHAVLYSTLLGGALSLSVEILQAYIPQRGSGMTDVVTNTLGAALGAALFTHTGLGEKLLPRAPKLRQSKAGS